MEALTEALSFHHLKDCTALTLLGLASLLIGLIVTLRVVIWTPFKLYFLAQYLPGVNLQKLGQWAVVTGATDGIGKGYAEALAKRGLDIVLISRSPEKLSNVANDIKQQYKVQVRVVAVDFTQVYIYDKIDKELEGLDIAILVNNVGIGTKSNTFLQAKDIINTTIELVNVNCVAMTNMCALVLPRMLQKNRGVIVNVSSLASKGYIGGSVYSATKSYVGSLSDCLQRTYKTSDVIIQTVEPGLVETNLLFTALQPSILKQARRYTAVTVDSFVNSAIATIGWTNVSHGHFLHYLVYLISSVAPQRYADDALLSDLGTGYTRVKK